MVIAASLVDVPTGHPQTSDNAFTEVPARTITPDEAWVLSRVAVKALRHIVQARADIRESETDQAQDELQKAMALIEIIKGAVPTVKVKDQIWIAKKHLTYDGREKVASDLIPIYASLDEMEGLVHVDTARDHIQSAEEQLKRGDTEKACKELELADRDLESSEIELPITNVEKCIMLAQNCLSKHETGKADEALRTAEEGLQFISTDIYSPLVLAERSLWQGIGDYSEKKFEEARADIRRTKSHLKRSIKYMDAKTKAEGEKLLQELAALEDRLLKYEQATEAHIRELWPGSRPCGTTEPAPIWPGAKSNARIRHYPKNGTVFPFSEICSRRTGINQCRSLWLSTRP